MPDKAALALDLDGTLITCANRQTVLACACGAAHGLRVDPQQFWAAKREGDTTVAALESQGASQPIATAIADHWVDAVESPYWLGFDRLFDDIRASLASLEAAQLRRVLLTARAQPHWLYAQLARLGLTPLLDEVIVVPPHRASAAKAEALATLRPVGFIGDTESDAAAARAAKTPFVALDRGQRSATFPRGAGVGNDVHDLDAALALLTA